MSEDTRSLQQLAKESLEIQNACNLSGVVHSWSRSVKRLRELLPNSGTDQINRHFVNVLFADKLADLTGANGSLERMPIALAYSAAHDCVATVEV